MPSAISAMFVPVCVFVTVITSPLMFKNALRSGHSEASRVLNDSTHFESSLDGNQLCRAPRACQAGVNQHAFVADPIADDVEAGHVVNLRAGPAFGAALRGQRQCIH